jgi:catechol 2,3-dioxygenase-like lactoylglutathione lyase family enzyme
VSFAIQGLNHLGLVVDDIDRAKQWFAKALGLRIIEDRGELVFLMAGDDVLAIKTPRMAVAKPEHGGEQASYGDASRRAGWQTLDHYGFYATTPEEVDAFAEHIVAHGATILKGPYDRRDGRSVYFKDPLGNVGEYLFFRPS